MGRLTTYCGPKLALNFGVFGSSHTPFLNVAATVAGATAYAGDLPQLLVCRFLTGLGLGGAMPSFISLASEYVPKALFEYWKKRDPIARLENYLVRGKKWLTPDENQKLIADVEEQLEADREFAANSPMPSPESAADGVYCENGCHDIKPKYAMPKARSEKRAGLKSSEAAVHLK